MYFSSAIKAEQYSKSQRKDAKNAKKVVKEIRAFDVRAGQLR